MYNYSIVKRTINEILYRLHSEMNDYLENIMNSPSTINRIIKYYHLGYQIDEPTKRFIMFENNIVKEYEVVLKYETEFL